jgi:hypothetical protein
MNGGGVPTDDSDAPTAENLIPSWRQEEPEARAMLRFTVAWWVDAPDRVGQSFVVPERRIFGRSQNAQAATLELRRPTGTLAAAPPTKTTTLSRQQLELLPEGPDTVRVRNLGRRPLRHNGEPVSECVVGPHDVLHIEDVAIFVVDTWPEIQAAQGMSPSGVPAFAFGEGPCGSRSRRSGSGGRTSRWSPRT